MEENTVIDLYIQQVKKELYRLAPADAFLSALRESLYDYADHNPNCTLEDLIHQFGSPQETAREFLGSMEDIPPKAKARKKRFRWIITTVLAVLLAAVIAHCIDLSRQEQSMDADIIEIYEDGELIETVPGDASPQEER